MKYIESSNYFVHPTFSLVILSWISG